MLICNNSNLSFEVRLECPGAVCQKQLQPQERVRAEDLFATQGKSTPRYFKMKILHNGVVIKDRSFIEKNTYVGLLGPHPHVDVSFEEDASEEAHQATSEIVRLVADTLKKMMEQKQKEFSKWEEDFRTEVWEKKDDSGKFSFFCCLTNCDVNLLDQQARLPQIWTAFKEVLGIDPAETTHLVKPYNPASKETTKVDSTQLNRAPTSIRVSYHPDPEENDNNKWPEVQLFIRGNAPGMNDWNNLIPLKKVGNRVWLFETAEKFDNCEYKIFLKRSPTDEGIWEIGENHKISYGKNQIIIPRF